MVLVAAAIEIVVDVVGAGAVGADRLGAGVRGGLNGVALAAGIACIQIRGTRRKQHQGSRIAAVERQFDDVLLRDHLTQGAGPGFDQLRIGLYRNGFVGGSDLQTDGTVDDLSAST